MRLSFRGHFDERAIVPDEPVELPLGEPLTVDVAPTTPAPDLEIAARLAVVDRMAARAIPGLNLPAEALSRESIYGDD